MLAEDGSKTPIEVIRDIIVHELELSDDRAMLYNQKWNIPTLNEMFVVVEYRFAKPVASNLKYLSDSDGVSGFGTEARLVMAEFITVGIYSRNLEALQRKEEVLMAINSDYARQMMELHSFKVFKMAPIKDLSFVEGAARIFRFDIEMTLLSKYKLVKDVSWFDTFATEVDFENPILKQQFQLGG